jgi:aspartate aminotransferase
MQFSQRAQQTPSSPIRKFAKYEQAARDRGISVLKLNIGQPDLHTPKPIRKAFHKFKNDIVLYAPSAGLPETIDAWRVYYKSHGHEIGSDEIIVTSGGSEAILFALLATCDPGDEIIVFEPFYTNFAGFAAMAGITLVPVTLDFERNFALPSVAELESKITEKTKAMIVNNPNNPTGVVYSSDDIQALVNVAYKKNLFIISDEVYREFIFDNSVHASFLNYPEIADRVIVIDSVSKRFNHCGGRVGCLVSRNKELMGAILKFAQARLSVPTLEQLSVIPLLTRPREYTDSVKDEYMKRREIVVQGLKSIEGVSFVEPNGSFYVIAQLPVDNAEKFVQFMLEDFEYNKETVMVAPAAGFYATPGMGEKQIRIAFVLDEPELERAMGLLKKGLEKYLIPNT